MERLQRKQRLVGIALMLALVASLGLASASGTAVADQELLVNGSFEGGFAQVPGCGAVGTGWKCFTNGGTVDYGFYDDQWGPVVADGSHSQLIELSTMQYIASEADRFAGIYQKVAVVKGQVYEFRLAGGMRERGPDPHEDPYRYRVQWGYTANGSTDWTEVTNWVELPWDKIDERTAPTGLESYSVQFAAPSHKITLFVRVWKKWGTAPKELDVNLDAISLWGPGVKKPVEPAGPIVVLPGPVTTDGCHQPEACGGIDQAEACGGMSYLVNGDFEGGFVDGVGNGWAAFTNGGAAEYGFYDEMWPPVVKDGEHSQLIEINTKQFPASDPDRYAGIYQLVEGLKKGATYEFSLWGEMRREEAQHPDEDPYSYRVQWGYVRLDADASPWDISNWVELPWDTIYPRTEPGPMASYTVQFRAPSSKILLAVRAWKKWGTTYRELDVNLDAISLVKCPLKPSVGCSHVVARGDSLRKIAKQYHTTVAALMESNRLGNPNVLAVGQGLSVPCYNPKPPAEEPRDCKIVHAVERGDTLYGLAKKHGTTVAAIVESNHLANPNLINVGQKLCVPAR